MQQHGQSAAMQQAGPASGEATGVGVGVGVGVWDPLSTKGFNDRHTRTCTTQNVSPFMRRVAACHPECPFGDRDPRGGEGEGGKGVRRGKYKSKTKSRF